MQEPRKWWERWGKSICACAWAWQPAYAFPYLQLILQALHFCKFLTHPVWIWKACSPTARYHWNCCWGFIEAQVHILSTPVRALGYPINTDSSKITPSSLQSLLLIPFLCSSILNKKEAPSLVTFPEITVILWMVLKVPTRQVLLQEPEDNHMF